MQDNICVAIMMQKNLNNFSLMNKENASKLWKIIQEAGDYLRH